MALNFVSFGRDNSGNDPTHTARWHGAHYRGKPVCVRLPVSQPERGGGRGLTGRVHWGCNL